MKNQIKENLTKSDVSKEIKIYMDTKEFKSKIEKIVITDKDQLTES